jgi:galactose mutarotase-like enzyme
MFPYIDIETEKDIYPIVAEPILVPVKSFTMVNKNNVEVIVISWGATIVSLKYPDKYGCIADVVLGFDDLQSKNT